MPSPTPASRGALNSLFRGGGHISHAEFAICRYCQHENDTNTPFCCPHCAECAAAMEDAGWINVLNLPDTLTGTGGCVSGKQRVTSELQKENLLT